jgi:hypothetical protein
MQFGTPWDGAKFGSTLGQGIGYRLG